MLSTRDLKISIRDRLLLVDLIRTKELRLHETMSWKSWKFGRR